MSFLQRTQFVLLFPISAFAPVVDPTGCAYYGARSSGAPTTANARRRGPARVCCVRRGGRSTRSSAACVAYEESGRTTESNPFTARAVRIHLRKVRNSQAKARGIPYEKKKKRKRAQQAMEPSTSLSAAAAGSSRATTAAAAAAAAQAGGSSAASSST
jgi:hypothetical protein